MPLPIHVIARHWARPDTVDEVRRILLGLIEPSRKEPGCVKYELLQNADDPADFTFVETFASDAALEVHAAAPYIAGLAPRLKELVARPSEVSRYRAIAADPGRTASAGCKPGRRGPGLREWRHFMRRCSHQITDAAPRPRRAWRPDRARWRPRSRPRGRGGSRARR